MSDPNWMSAANAHHRESVLSKIRADLGVEASSRSTHFCGVVERRSKRYPMSLQTTFGLARGATRPPGRNPILRRLTDLLRRRRDRAHSRADLCELDDWILQDIGLRRDALLGSPTRSFRQ
jgi:uncharacterized protein YjiS (DUF1127 family)